MTNYELGYNGYKNGINTPSQCAEWRKQLEGKQVGEESGAVDWSQGWNKAQQEELRAKFPEMYVNA